MHSKPKPKKPKRAQPKPPSSADDWSDPASHPQMSPGIPIAIFTLLLLGLIAYGFFG